jgi:exosortase
VGSAALAGSLLWAYWPTLAELAQRWAGDANYGHGFLVPAFALAMLWLRRGHFADLTLRFRWSGLWLLGAGLLLRLAGTYCYSDWLEAVSLLPCLAGAAVLVGGPQALRGAWPAIAFLAFMVPLPYRLEVALALPLQWLATRASTYALQTLGLPALAEGNVIVLDEVRIGVVEACSGLGMLLFFFALSTAAAFLIRRPLWEKLVIVASAVPIALVANVARITATGVLSETAGARAADLVYHDLAGWLMMPLALGILWLQLRLHARLLQEPDKARPVFRARPGSGAHPAGGPAEAGEALARST